MSIRNMNRLTFLWVSVLVLSTLAIGLDTSTSKNTSSSSKHSTTPTSSKNTSSSSSKHSTTPTSSTIVPTTHHSSTMSTKSNTSTTSSTHSTFTTAPLGPCQWSQTAQCRQKPLPFQTLRCWLCGRVPSINDDVILDNANVQIYKTVWLKSLVASESTIDVQASTLGIVKSLNVENRSKVYLTRGSKLSGTAKAILLADFYNSSVAIFEANLQRVIINFYNTTDSKWGKSWVVDAQSQIFNDGKMDWTFKDVSQMDGKIYNSGAWEITVSGTQPIITQSGDAVISNNGSIVVKSQNSTSWNFPCRLDAGLGSFIQSSRVDLNFEYGTYHTTGSVVDCAECSITLSGYKNKTTLMTSQHVILDNSFLRKGSRQTSIFIRNKAEAHVIGTHEWDLVEFLAEKGAKIAVPHDSSLTIKAAKEDVSGISLSGEISDDPIITQGTLRPLYVSSATINLMSPKSVFLAGKMQGNTVINMHTPTLIFSGDVAIDNSIDLRLYNTTVQLDPTHPISKNSTGQIELGDGDVMNLQLTTQNYNTMKIHFAKGSRLLTEISAKNIGKLQAKTVKFEGKLTIASQRIAPELDMFYPLIEGSAGPISEENFEITGPWPSECLETRAETQGQQWGIIIDNATPPSGPSELGTQIIPPVTPEPGTVHPKSQAITWNAPTKKCNTTTTGYRITTTLKDFTPVETAATQWPVPLTIPICTVFQVSVATMSVWDGDKKTVIYSDSVSMPVSVDPIGYEPKAPRVVVVDHQSISTSWSASDIKPPCNRTVYAVEIKISPLQDLKSQRTILSNVQSQYIYIDDLRSCAMYQISMRYHLQEQDNTEVVPTDYGPIANSTIPGIVTNVTSSPSLSAENVGATATMNVRPAVYMCPCGVQPIYSCQLWDGKSNYTDVQGTTTELSLDKVPSGKSYMARCRYVCRFTDTESISPWSAWSTPADASPFYWIYFWELIVLTVAVTGLLIIVIFVVVYLMAKNQSKRARRSTSWRYSAASEDLNDE